MGEKKESREKSGRSLGVENQSRHDYPPRYEEIVVIGGRTWGTWSDCGAREGVKEDGRGGESG